MTATLQRPTVALGACINGQAHNWHVSTLTEFEILPEPDADDPHPAPVRGRVVSAFFCSHCLAQVDAAVLYAEREKDDSPEAGTLPAGDPRANVRALERLRDDLAQAAVIGDGTPEGEEAAARAAALEALLARPAL